jgi:hypothetical protein
MPPLLTVALSKDPAEQRGNQSQRQFDHTPGITQYVPVPVAPGPGPPRPEQYAPAIPVRVPPPTFFPRVHIIQPFLLCLYLQELRNDQPPSHFPPPHIIAGPSRGNPGLVHSGIMMSVAEDLKDLASHYLHNPGSHVDKLRMRRSRSGAVKVLILLEIDDTM